MCERLPKFKGYKRKDPFEFLIYMLNVMHEEFKFYDLEEVSKGDIEDDWVILKKLEEPNSPYTEYSAIK